MKAAPNGRALLACAATALLMLVAAPSALAQGLRVVVLSTTNAALDQALERIAADPEMGEAIQAGTVVRTPRC